MDQTTFTTAEVLTELERILETRNFRNSPTLSRFLRFVVTQKLEGHENEIKEYTVGVEVLHKPTSFNPMLDASVRIHAIRLRKLLAEYYEQTPLPQALHILLPKGSYVPVFAEAWPNPAPPNGEPIAASVPTENSVHQESVCIIPFTSYVHQAGIDISADEFCQFLSEKLSLFQDIRVASFEYTRQFFNNGGSLQHLGSACKVQYYLAGTLEIEARHIRTMVHLHDALTHQLIWSQSFDGNTKKNAISVVIDQIITTIVSSIAGYSGVIHYRKHAINGPLPSMTDKLAIAVFWFYHYQLNTTQAICHKAIRELEHALDQNEESALGYAVLAHLYGASVVHNYPYSNDPLGIAQRYVNLALSLNPNCQQAYITQGWLHLLARRKEDAVYNLEKGYLINPHSAFFNFQLSLCMALLGEYDKSQQYLEKALKMNPQPYWWLHKPNVFYWLKNRDYEKMLFAAQSIKSQPRIHEQVFEIVALYYLDKRSELEQAVKAYQNKYKDGFVFVEDQMARMIYDEELSKMFTVALQDIRNRYIK